MSLNEENREIIQDMPKIVLHIHLDGSIRPETAKEWATEILDKEVDRKEIEKMLMVEKDCRDLNEYLQKFDLPIKMLQTAEHIERAVYEIYEDLARQNVIYAEVRFAPSKHLKGGLSYNEVVEAGIRGLNRAKSKFNIEGNLILCCMRGDDEQNRQENIETVKVAKRYLGEGVCGIDLAGAEALFNTENFEEIFRLAKENNIPFTIHAGEADGPESIKSALAFGTKRIGHGVRCIEDPILMTELKNKGILLEICPTSNLQTKAVEGKHPIEEIYRAKIPVTISPDNTTVSNTSIIEEYEYIMNNTGLEIPDLIEMNFMALRSIFDTREKKGLLAIRMSAYKNKILQITRLGHGLEFYTLPVEKSNEEGSDR